MLGYLAKKVPNLNLFLIEYSVSGWCPSNNYSILSIVWIFGKW